MPTGESLPLISVVEAIIILPEPLSIKRIFSVTLEYVCLTSHQSDSKLITTNTGKGSWTQPKAKKAMQWRQKGRWKQAPRPQAIYDHANCANSPTC